MCLSRKGIGEVMDNRKIIEQIIKIRHNDTEEQLRLCQKILDNNPDDYERARGRTGLLCTFWR